jgi:hypothetical protein
MRSGSVKVAQDFGLFSRRSRDHERLWELLTIYIIKNKQTGERNKCLLILFWDIKLCHNINFYRRNQSYWINS